ncbi:MAG: low molecular weight phosphotyrosine protein phosphatase [Gammaproteobacteria bacterium]|nr:low molecular weight phosphotyrosine protein phosphatase [Gammaproteobacteria bacterium]
MYSVLFVCLGNICRSPTAEGIFRGLVEKQGLQKLIHADSAGTGAWHIGNAPDQRAQETALARNIVLGGLKARQVELSDFLNFNLIIAMDSQNLANLDRLAGDHKNKLHLMLDFAPKLETRDVPDPYYGTETENGFDAVFDMIETASVGLLNHIKNHTRL